MKTLVPAAPAAEPEFLLAVQRAVRNARDRMALLVHLSRLRDSRAALPPPHQIHVARSILQEAAQRFEGQVYIFRNGDLALLCRAQMSRDDGRTGPGGAPVAKAFEPSALPGILARLFHADMARLISLWPLATEGDALLAYAADRLAEAPPGAAQGAGPKPAMPLVSVSKLSAVQAPGHPGAQFGARSASQSGGQPGPQAHPGSAHPGSAHPGSAQSGSGNPGSGRPALARLAPAAEPGAISFIDGIGALLAGSRVAELMHRQTAIRLRVDDIPGRRFRNAVFRELTFSVTALEARVATLGSRGLARADPFLFRHLAGRLDARMLTLLLAEAGTGHLLDILAAEPDDPAWHINLTLPAIMSDAFHRLLDLKRRVGLGVEIAYGDAAADPGGFVRAREVLAQAGVTLVLDGIDDTALRLTRPWRLAPDLLKLDWSPRLAIEADAGDAGDDGIWAALERIGPASVVLQRSETPEALAWGMARGIELFQGRQIDALLAERRMAVCELAGGCTLRQCLDRGSAAGNAGRVGCGNTRLLDGGPGKAAPESGIETGIEGGAAHAAAAG